MTLIGDNTVGIVILLLALVLLIIGANFLLRRNPRAITTVENKEGKVWISLNALKEVTHSLIATVEGASKATTKLYIRRGKLYIKVVIKLSSDKRLSDVSSAIQERITEGLKHHLSLEKIGKIEVMVNHFNSKQAVPSEFEEMRASEKERKE